MSILKPLTRRNFLSTASFSFLSVPLLGGFSQKALAAESTPKWPKPSKAADSNAGASEKLPAFEASTEQQKSENSQPLDEDQRIGVAVVGLGRLAIEEIIPALGQSKMCKLTALVSGDRKKAERIAKRYGSVQSGSIYSYKDFDRIKDDKRVDYIYIVLPNSMHKEYVVRAAKAGKHILCEKPMATSAAEAKEMIDACKQANVKLMIAYRQQYEPNNRWVEQVARQKVFGHVKYFEASNFQVQSGKEGGKQQWRHIKAMAGGGALPDIGLYCLNASRFLTGEEPYEVMATTYSTPNDPRYKEVEESISFMMKFPSGLIAMCSACYAGHETKRYRLTAENGWFGMDPSFAYSGLKTEASWAFGSPIEHKEQLSIGDKNQFALEMDHMADCIRHNKHPHSPGEEGWQDHRIMDAIYESARTNKPVQLERIEKADAFRHDTIA